MLRPALGPSPVASVQNSVRWDSGSDGEVRRGRMRQRCIEGWFSTSHVAPCLIARVVDSVSDLGGIKGLGCKKANAKPVRPRTVVYLRSPRRLECSRHLKLGGAPGVSDGNPTALTKGYGVVPHGCIESYKSNGQDDLASTLSPVSRSPVWLRRHCQLG